MIYTSVRVGIVVILLICICIIFKKYVFKKSKRIFICVMGAVVCTVLVNTPFENLFMSFDSPEAVFQYVQSGPIVKVSEGSESAMILYKSGETSSGVFFAAKDSGEYKICPFYSTEKCKQVIENSYVVTIYHINNTSDYYLEVVGTVSNEHIPIIVDNTGNSYEIIREDLLDQDIIRCVGCIDYDQNYQLFIDDVLMIP